jgi:hypothetical protein
MPFCVVLHIYPYLETFGTEIRITCHTVPNGPFRDYFTVACVSKTAYLLVLITFLSYLRKKYYLSSYFYVTFIGNNSKFLIVAMSSIVFLVHTLTT